MTSPQKPQQFGICSWSTHAKSPDELMDRLDKLGLKKVQLHMTPVWENPAVWGDVHKRLTDKGYKIVSGMFGSVGEDYSTLESIRKTGGVVPDQHWEGNWKIVQNTAKVAKQMGVPLVSTHAGFLPEDPNDASFRKLVDRISQIAGCFKDHGLTLLFETGQETADTLSRFLDALNANGAQNVGVNFDPANMILYAKGDPVASLKRLMPRVKQVHIKDARKTATPGTWGAETAIGDGEVDWKAFLAALAEGDYKGDLVIEREAGEDRVGDVRLAVERLTKLM